jgi:anaerobic magnesium-protoporphyrin IX monomethyl ester cyclase
MLKMKILLIFSYECVSVTTQTVHTPPLGIGYIAGALLKDGHIVNIVDLQVQSVNNIFKYLDYDIIGISSLTSHFHMACSLIRDIKAAGFKGRIIIGGAHATAIPERSLRESCADLVCSGEGEASMVKLANGESLENIGGLGWLENGKYRQNIECYYSEHLDDYPPPAFHLFELGCYGSYNMAIVPPGTRDGVIMTSRGCPYSCDFCFKLNKCIRFRSPENIVAEICRLKAEFGYTKFSFIDDCFNANPKRAKDICRLIIRECPGIIFTLPNGIRANLVDDELAELMQAAGCIGANIGVESWDDDVRAKMDKKLKKEDAINAVRTLRRKGIICTAYFIMGHYHDSVESIKRNIEAVKELDADFFQFSKFIPMPGSLIYKRIEEEGRIQEQDFSKYSIFGDASLMEHPSLTAGEIDAAIKTAYRKAAFRFRTLKVLFSNPIIILNVLLNFGQVTRMTKFKSS